MSWKGTPKVFPNKVDSQNTAPNNIQDSYAEGNTNKNKPRVADIRRDKDEQKNFSISLMDVDTTIMNYITDVLRPVVPGNGGTVINVPVVYGSPERWKSMKKDGFLHDSKGKIQCPIIMVKRTSMGPDDGFQTFNRYLQYPVVKQYSEKNSYDRFSLMNGFNNRVYEIYNVSLPDHIIINYDVAVWTDLVEQNNSIVEKFNFATDDYWGDKKRFKFRTTIADYQHQTEIDSEEDRIVRTNFGITVHAYILPETFEDFKTTYQKNFSKRKVIFNAEVDVSLQDPEYFVQPTGKTQMTSVQGTMNQDSYDFSRTYTELLNYVSHSKEIKGEIVTLDNGSGELVLRFANAEFLTPPLNTIDEYSVDRFMLLIDGRNVTSRAIVTQMDGNDLIARVNRSALTFELSSELEIIALGKFK